MAVQEQTPLQEYTANGIAKQFDLEFDCESADHLIVSIDDLEVLHTDWYLSGNAIMFHVAPANGKQVKIQRNTPFNRLADYQSYNNSFRPPAINKDFDRIWWKLQELGVADWILSNRISALKAYVDDRDDELRAYLMEEIRKQGVALDQLDDYYNYLMERLAQIAVDKGWDSSFVVDENWGNQKEINNKLVRKSRELVSVKDHGAIEDGVTDNASILQDYADIIETERKSYMHFPMYDESYLIDGTITFKYPVGITGTKPASQTRNSVETGKKGNIVIGGNSDTVFDFGASLSKDDRGGYYADCWTVKNIGFIQADGVAARTKTCIKHTAATDGPDRFLMLREVSAMGVRHALHITNQNKSVQVASIVVENCALSNNYIPLFAEGNALGLRFVGNQCEQNFGGAIHGTFNSSVVIHDNMLEGQPNTINITVPSITGNKPKISIQGNYFELNSGDYLINVTSNSSGGVIEVKNNYQLLMQNVTDTLRVTGIYERFENHDFIPTLNLQLMKKAEGKISPTNQFNIRVGGLNRYNASFYLTTKLDQCKVDNSFSYATPSNPSLVVSTNQGDYRYIGMLFSYQQLPINVEVNDVIQLDFAYVDHSATSGYGGAYAVVYTNDYSLALSQGTVFHERTQGDIKVVTMFFIVKKATNALRFRVENIGVDTYLLGASAKIIGQMTVSEDIKISGLQQNAPKLLRATESAISLTLDVADGTVVPANGTYVINKNTPGTPIGSKVEMYCTYQNVNLMFYGVCDTTNQIKLVVRNLSGAAITLPACTLTYKIF